VKWKPNVFVVAFVLGAAALTVLPFLQKFMLKAPVPIVTLPQWPQPGRVAMVSFVPATCDAACAERQQAFERGRQHIEDLDGGVVLVSLSASASPELVEAFRVGWGTWGGGDAGSTAEEFTHLPGFAVVDQNGALRGFWKDDAEGRGNAINAARLLWKQGAAP
jgi:hypothetical protein